ncbi:hypothetical protein HYU90_01055 [Candidatus Collierbacteria bacterium]|nr:hypothetical protein [Candidatus Collierbacteria bacterium]
MKAYIVPVENVCNARCFFCITMFKKEKEYGTFLETKNLGKLKCLQGIDSLEITGGGEPLIHPKIDEIVKTSCQILPATLYTNGKLLSRLGREVLKRLRRVTISRHHFDETTNEKVMGIKYEDQVITETIKRGANVRLTAVLCKRGMSSVDEVWDYLLWGKSMGVKNVQIRQFFEFGYTPEIKSEIVRTEPILRGLLLTHPELRFKEEKYPTIYLGDLKAEFEGDKCACSAGVPNLRGDGKLYFGWTKTPLPIGFYKKDESTTTEPR